MTKFLIYISKLIITLLIITAITVYFTLSNSLATLDGTVHSPVSDTVTIERDRAGIPTIMAQNRKDLSYALGYLHGQERLFQMDLLRRNSAGELSELFGPLALSHDTNVRNHQFRNRAEQYVKLLKPEHLAILTQYTAGVNQGIDDLTSRPLEYWMLNKTPQKWRPADSLLVIYSMYLDLQYANGERERLLGHLQRNLLPDVYQFLTPKGSRWDASIDGTTFTSSPVPSNTIELAPILNLLTDNATSFELFDNDHEALKGSNNWVVGGQLSYNGAAIVADDMHLGLAVPNIWYRASLRYNPANTTATQSTQRDYSVAIDGVTLPGTPSIVIGSNRHIAWGFTNSYGDWNDVVKLQLDDSGTQYKTKEGYRNFDIETETILVSGNKPERIEIRRTIWGPVIGRDHDGSLIALRWVAHDPQGINFDLLDFEKTTTIDDAIAVANGAGIPAQNIVIGDKLGNIAWTIAGVMPEKFDHNPKLERSWLTPQDWSNGDLGWQGYIASNKYPVVKNPKDHRIWTANSRVVGGEFFDIIGDGGYALGARSQQIKHRLFEKESFSEADLFAIQNDTKADFLSRWHQLLTTELLTPNFVENHQLTQLPDYLNNWGASADIDSVGYLFVRQFRLTVRDQLFSSLEENLDNASLNKRAKLSLIRHQLEVPMWQMITQQPAHLIPSGYPSWNMFLEQMIIRTHSQLLTQFGDLSQATWGNYNNTHIQHPLAKAVPALSFLLDMPRLKAAGDSYMPRVQGKSFGSSQRMVVSPGNEAEGIMQMPSGQAGHPLSPYFQQGHKEWIEGQATPLLPGATKYKLEMIPNTAI
ncbi:penicillin acylase family protein [Psychrosphaera sp. 1_MG-2023]|uniref:penicillin acylase family protein n=1 Tax=Psychrosphaera sp. 1_MG-2023 TaxID=3062643 RepID=UPI0026E3B681|nr:penicillin acylase family protein [Psychrosphaera sp. 1_MG-2023]MDO6719495.1 penicillin acylase family protein [Psychrosphaera sp. 1_MG-2023]